MKLLYDFFPILLFFIAYKFSGIYIATVVAIVVTLLQVIWYKIKYRRFEALHLVTLTMIVLFGGLTLILHNPIFIKWKPTLVYWIFSIAFLVSHLTQKPLIQRMMGTKIALPRIIWYRLNVWWGLFFFTMGFINLYVAYHFSTDGWVNFKLYGIVGLLILFAVLQAWYLSRYMDAEKS